MTTCNFFNSKGEPSKLYEQLETRFGANIGAKILELSNSQIFRDTHPDVKLTADGEVELSEITALGLPELVNKPVNIYKTSNSDIRKVVESVGASTIKISNVTNPITPLETIITREDNTAAIGDDSPYNITIQLNVDSTEFNKIDSNNRKGLVALSLLPDNIKSTGIALAKKSNLHDLLSKVYDSLSEKDFDNELLMLALSNEGFRNTPEWELYYKKVVDYLTDTFDITPTESIEFMNTYLTNDSVSDLVDTLSGLRKKRMIDQRVIKNTLKPVAELTSKLSQSITKKIKIYFSNMSEADKSGSASYKHLQDLSDMFEQYKTTQNVNAVIGFITEMGYQIGLVEKRIAKLELDVLSATNITDESLYRLHQYISVFDNLEDIQILLSQDKEFAQELSDLFKDHEELKKFRNLKSYVADLMARNVSIKAKTTNISNIFLANRLTELGKGRIDAKYRVKYRKEFDEQNRERKIAADKKASLKRSYKADQDKFVNKRVASNKKQILGEEAARISTLLQASPRDISFFERMFLDRNALNDDLIQIVSEMIDKADYEIDRATTEVYKALYDTTSTYEKDVRDMTNQEKKYDELISPNVEYNEDTGSVTVVAGKSNHLTGKFFPQVYEIQRELWSAYYEALRTGSANDPEELRFKAERFTRDNFDSPFTNAYYEVIDSLKDNPEAELVFNAYRNEKAKLYRPYKGRTIPANVQTQIDALEAQYSQIFSIYDATGKRKSGAELEIALAIAKHKTMFGAMFNRDFKATEFSDAREAAKVAGKEQEWLDDNTTLKTSKDFFSQYYKVLKLDDAVQRTNEEYRILVKEYKALEKSVNWTQAESDKIKSELKDKFTEFMQAVKDAKHPDIKAFMDNYLEFKTNDKLVLSANDYIADIAGISNGARIALPIYSTIETTDPSYQKRKPKNKWYARTLKDIYVKEGRTEFDQVIPTAKWRNPNYSKIQSTASLRAAYDSYVRIMMDSDELLLHQDRLISGDGDNTVYKLPTVSKSSLYEIIGEQGLFNYVKTKFQRFRDNEPTEPGFGSDPAGTNPDITSDAAILAVKNITREVSILTDEAGEPYKRVPVNFRYKAKDKESSFDLPTILALNYQMSKNYKEKSDIVFAAELVKGAMAQRDVVRTAPSALEGVKTYIDALTGKSVPRPVVSKGEDSNAYKALSSAIDDRIYGMSSTSTYKMAQMANLVSEYTAAVLLMGNYMSAGTNLMTGYIYNFIESVDSRHFDQRDLRKAQSKYYGNTLAITNDLGRRVKTSKTNLINEKFTVLTDWRAVGEHFINSNKLMALGNKNVLHGMSGMAEHALQSTVAYSVLNHIKVMNKDKQFIRKDGTVTENVDEAMTLDEAYTVQGHNLVLNPNAYYTTLNEDFNLVDNAKEIEFQVSRLIKDINADMQGQYNVKHKAEVQRAWWGQLIMLLRKFAPRGVHRRFRSFGSVRVPFDSLIEDDKFFSRAQGVYNEGYYTTSVRLLAELYRDAKVLKWQLLSFNGLSKMNSLRKLKISKMEDWQQSNLKKTTRDLLTASTLYVIGILAANLKDDEEEGVTRSILVATSFYSIRGFKELTTFINPNEMLSTLRTPTIALTMVNRLLIFLGQLGADGINLVTEGDVERYATGRRKGETKLYKKVEDIVPLLKNVDRDMEEALSWFLNKRAY